MVTGSVTNASDVAKVFEGGDVTAAIIALGGKTSDVGTTMLTDGTTNVINAMKANGVKRICTVTSIGTGDSQVSFTILEGATRHINTCAVCHARLLMLMASAPAIAPEVLHIHHCA